MWESSREQPTSCLQSQLPDGVTRYLEPKQLLSPSAQSPSRLQHPFPYVRARMPTWPFDFIPWGRNAHSAHDLLVQAGGLPGAPSGILHAELAEGCFSCTKGKARSKVRGCYLDLHRQQTTVLSSQTADCKLPLWESLTPCTVSKDKRDPAGKEELLSGLARKEPPKTCRWSLNRWLTL